MPSLVTALTVQESVANRTNKLSERRDGYELLKLLQAAQTDISVLQANYAALLSHLDTIASSAGAGAVTGTLLATTNRATYGPDVSGTTPLLTTLFQP